MYQKEGFDGKDVGPDEPNWAEGENDFCMVHHACLAATSILIIARQRIAKFISNIKEQKLPLGWMGKFGNKGAVSISFDVLNKKVLVINNHLEAHMEYRQYRHD